MRYHRHLIHHHPLKRLAAVLLTVALLSGCAPVRTLPTLVGALARPPAAPAFPVYTNPVFDRDFPDPFVLPTEDGYYAYATNSGGRNIQVIYSPDLLTWERAGEDGDALPKLPTWAQSNASLTWAPSVLQRVDEDGLARAGLAGQHGKAGLEVELQRRDDDEVLEAKAMQHG